jgi:hypothetical protein
MSEATARLIPRLAKFEYETEMTPDKVAQHNMTAIFDEALSEIVRSGGTQRPREFGFTSLANALEDVA